MGALTQACQQSEENVLMILAMCGLDTDETTQGVETVIKGFTKHYEDQDGSGSGP